MGERVQLQADDGFALGAYVSEPAGAPKGAVVVIQEIFGADRMVPMTLEGLSRGMKELTR